MSIVAEIVAYKGEIFTNLLVLERNDFIVPTGSRCIGTVIIGSKERVGISEKALALLDKLKRNNDAIGDFDWWLAGDDYCVSWFGPIFRVIRVAECEAARGFKVYPDQCVIIENRVTNLMKKAYANNLNPWKQPFGLD